MMRITKHDTWISIQSRRNHCELVLGNATKKHGLMGGIEFYESYDWWHMTIGQTLWKWYISIFFRWRVFGCQYKRSDPTDIYMD